MLQIVPLGGVGEFGMNMLALTWGETTIVVDAGVMFPDPELLGVDRIIPDLTYLQQKRVAALVLTHGHEDHIGAVPHVLSFVDVKALRPLKVVIDAGNGMAGLSVPRVFERLPFEVVPLYFELDGTFPNHPADPIQPENLAALRAAVLEHKAVAGIAFSFRRYFPRKR